MSDEVETARCTLFLAVTRPPLFLGVPVEAVLFCGMGGLILGPILTGDMIMVLPIGGALGAVARLVSRYDPLIFRVLQSWLESRPRGPIGGPVTAKKWWGGHSISPLRPTLKYTRAELDRHV